MNRFDNIINNFVLWGNKNDGLYAAVIIGSWTRNDHPADEFSDLDLVMIVDLFCKPINGLSRLVVSISLLLRIQLAELKKEGYFLTMRLTLILLFFRRSNWKTL